MKRRSKITSPLDQTLLAFARSQISADEAPRGATLCLEHDRIKHVAILATGFCLAVKRMPDGRGQNVALYIPGDILFHEGFTLGAATSSVVALTKVAFHILSHHRLRHAMEEDDHLAASFRRYVAHQGAIAQEWILSMGRRAAYERTAHLFCELIYRMRSVGSATNRCDFPLTQSELADLLGLSVVHVNRTLQRLRQDGYIALHRGTLEILDWKEFTALAGFDASYLDIAERK